MAMWATILDRSEEGMTLAIEMLACSYAPCISCSAHLMNVKFVGKFADKIG
jgi:coenzyme F420-reducing hydrogenase alpha subunit